MLGWLFKKCTLPLVLEIQQGPGDFWVHDHRSLAGQGFTEGTRAKEWRRGPNPGVTTDSAWAVQCMPTRHWSLGTGPVLTQLLTASSCPSCSWLSTKTCRWIWKVLSVSIYFLFQTLGILSFITRYPFMALIWKNKFIYTDFIFSKEIWHHYSVHMKQTQIERPSPASAETGQWMRQQNTGQGGERLWWAGLASLPTSSRYANRSTDTLRCSCRKRGPGIWHHKARLSITQSPQGSCLTLWEKRIRNQFRSVM